MAERIIDRIQKFSWIIVVLVLVFGWTSPVLMFISFLCMVGPIIFSFYYGRAWCGNFCPRGSLSGEVLSIISPRKPIPVFFKKGFFRIFMFVFLMGLFANNIYYSHGTLTGIGMAFVKMMAITTVMQVTFSLYVHPYAWCSFCPMGSVAYCITKLKKGRPGSIKINSGCKSCNVCKNNCPMQIDIPEWSSAGEVKDADCLVCRKCIKCCPEKCLKYE